MIGILLEHSNLKASRRALLASAAITLFIPQLQISGDGINFFGLVLSASQEQVFKTSWLITCYFFAIFFSFAVGQIATNAYGRFYQSIESRKSRSLEATKQVDNEIRSGGQPEPEMDPWWQAHDDAYQRLDRMVKFGKAGTSTLVGSLTFFVDVGAAAIVGVLAVLYPAETSSFLFG